MNSTAIFDKNVIEFVTVAAEYCTFLEQIELKERTQIVDVLPKLLPLLYLKAQMMPNVEPQLDIELEDWVTETQYNHLRAAIAAKLGADDDYLEVFVEEMRYSDTPLLQTISENLADIYQAVANFIHSYKSGLNSVMHQAVAQCKEQFQSYWGQLTVNSMRALHTVKYASPSDGEDVDSDFPESELW